ncbi:MAG: trigger factor [Paludibacteraceae bacterium]|nr:trigger factor [Paludibacteraceae bacterium]
MQITMSEVQNLQAQITLVIQPEDYQEQVEKEIRQLRQKAQIPGFRAGNVPKSLIKKMYGKNVLAEVINKETGVSLQKYIEENKLHVLGEPLPNEEQNQKVDLEFDNTFTFVFDIALAPELDTKMTGKNKITYYRVKVTDEMVDNQVRSYADRYGSYQEAEETAENDIIRGTIKENKEDGIVKEDAVLNPRYMKNEETKKLFTGLKKGASVTFDPMKAFESEVETASLLGIDKETAKGLTSEFTMTINSISRHTPAAIDGELFAKIYGENNIKDEADFRNRVREEIQGNMDQDSEYKFGLDVREAFMKKLEKADLPEAFLRRWIKLNNEKMTDEELDKQFPQMIQEFKWQLAKDQLMQQLDIKVEKEDVEAYAKKVAKMQFMQYGLMHIEDQYLDNFAQEMLKKDDQLRNIVERVAEEKIFEAEKKIMKVEEKEISQEDFSKLFA